MIYLLLQEENKKNKKMKKFGLIFILIFACTSIANAGLINYGIKGGLNFANLSGTDWHAASYYKTSFHAGAFIDVNLLGIVGVESGVYFSQKGWVAVTKDEYGEIFQKSNFSFNYIDIPILLRFKPIPLISLFVGPQASFYLNNKYVIIDSEGLENSYTEEYEDFDFSSPDLSLVVGTHTNLPLGFFISASYEMGFIPLYTNKHKIYNRVIKISAGYKF